MDYLNNKVIMNRRGRPCLRRKVRFDSQMKYFKPQGIPVASLDVVELKDEELEAIRLKNIKKLDQRECAQKMDTSSATFQRILSSAYEKISFALVEGKTIKIIDK